MAAWIPADQWLATLDAHREPWVPSYQQDIGTLATAGPPQAGPPLGRRAMAGVPRTTRVLDLEQARTAGELAARIGVGRAASRYGVHRRTLRDAWNAYGIEVTPPGAGRRRKVAIEGGRS